MRQELMMDTECWGVAASSVQIVTKVHKAAVVTREDGHWDGIGMRRGKVGAKLLAADTGTGL